MNPNYTNEHFSLSTAEEEMNSLTGQAVQPRLFVAGAAVPAGTYRVINGRLYRVAEGLPVAVAARPMFQP